LLKRVKIDLKEIGFRTVDIQKQITIFFPEVIFTSIEAELSNSTTTRLGLSRSVSGNLIFYVHPSFGYIISRRVSVTFSEILYSSLDISQQTDGQQPSITLFLDSKLEIFMILN
jgi:hypothetical protein